MVGVALSAALVLPSSPKLSDLSCLFTPFALDWFKSFWIPHNEWDTAAFSRISATSALDTAASNASVRTEAVLLCAAAIIDIKLGHKYTPIADILCFSDGCPISIFRLKIGLVAATSTAGLLLLMSRDNILDSIFIREALRNNASLTCAPIEIFSLNDRRRDLRAMLNVLDLTASRHASAEASHEERTLFMDPSLLCILGVRISTVEVIGFLNDPVDRGLAASGAATLACGLGDDNLFGVA